MAAFANTRWRKQDTAWLTLAVGVHGLLLLLPLGPEGAPEAPSHTVSVELARRPAEPASDSLLIPGAPTAPTERVAAPEPIPFLTRKPSVTSADNRLLDTAPAKDAAANPVTTARLLHMARHSTLDTQPSRTLRRLGSIPSPEESPGLSPAASLFAGMMPPPETEIVDRWMAADGSHNVVVNLPNGETVCGRAEAWNPMQPLVEHLMMFRTCGGGGKRTFEMASREVPDRRNPE